MEKTKTTTNIFSIHPLTYLFIFISLFTAKFKSIILFMSLIMFHELGHLLTAKLFNWKVDKIYIYPLGGITKFNDLINKPFKEEILVTIMGPVFQILLSHFLIKIDESVIIYNRMLLMFNLLPITPLDGGKLLNSILSLCFPYKYSLNIVIKISYIVYLIVSYIVLFNIKSIFFIIVVFLLIFKIIEEDKKKNYYFNKFVLERYLYIFKFKKDIIISNIKKMYKYRNNIIKENNRLLTEKEACIKLIKKPFN